MMARWQNVFFGWQNSSCSRHAHTYRTRYDVEHHHENVRRRHDYAPFVAAYLKKLAERGDLMQKIDEAKKKQRQR